MEKQTKIPRKHKLGTSMLVALVSIVTFGALFCAISVIVMIGWNAIVVAAFSTAVPITLLTAMYGVLFINLLMYINRSVQIIIEKYRQLNQLRLLSKELETTLKDITKNNSPDAHDVLRHFRNGRKHE